MAQRAPKPQRPATYDDIVALPEGIVGEIIDGELVTHPRPAPPHARSSSNLTVLINGPFGMGLGGPGGWVILDEPEIQFAKHTLVPDLAGWRTEHLPDLPEKGPLHTAPDWVCEVLSPPTEQDDRRRKLRIYAEHRVSHVWFLDPLVRTLEILRLQDGKWLIIGNYGSDDVVRAEPFEAVEVPLPLLWGEQRVPTRVV
jgi:Uma2 family endonuclease